MGRDGRSRFRYIGDVRKEYIYIGKGWKDIYIV